MSEQITFANSQILFNSITREFVICLILFGVLHFVSYALILIFSKKVSFHSSDYEDAVAYRVSFWLCIFSLATSIEAALLLPMSVGSNEVLLLYPNSSYIHWLDVSLLRRLWNFSFCGAYCSLFILLPFAYFFSESQGFSGSSTGLKARFLESFSLLFLMGLLLFGVLYLLLTMFQYKLVGIDAFTSVWTHYLPFLYSGVSFIGIVMLLVCTPIGFAHFFTVLETVVEPQYSFQQEEMEHSFPRKKNEFLFPPPKMEFTLTSKEVKKPIVEVGGGDTGVIPNADSGNSLTGSSSQSHLQLSKVPCQSENQFTGEIQAAGKELCRQRSCSHIVAMLFLLAFTVMAVLTVSQNTLALCFGIRKLPFYSQELSLGISSLSALGPVGTFLEIILILYLWCSSVVGFYCLPVFCQLRPQVGNTSMTHMIINCAILVILGSALPVQTRTLGITNFDLVGDFAKIPWLGNFYIVLMYNIIFVVTTVTYIGSKMTPTAKEIYIIFHNTELGIRREIYRMTGFKEE